MIGLGQTDYFFKGVFLKEFFLRMYFFNCFFITLAFTIPFRATVIGLEQKVSISQFSWDWLEKCPKQTNIQKDKSVPINCKVMVMVMIVVMMTITQ